MSALQCPEASCGVDLTVGGRRQLRCVLRAGVELAALGVEEWARLY